MDGKFLGHTKGNKDLHCNRTEAAQGGSGEGHSGGPSSKFIGETKGNRDLKVNRSEGVKEGGYKGK
jgi:hypothetical protein